MSKRKRESKPIREMAAAPPVSGAPTDGTPSDAPAPDEPSSPSEAGARTASAKGQGTRHVVCYAHRGARAHQPENTLAAFELAFNLGADAIECDVQSSRDGQLVIIHDGTVDRTTDGTGPVAEQRFAELRTLNAGARWRQQQLIPTLKETIELVTRRDGRLNLEIKGESVVECLATAEAVAPVLRALSADVRSRLLVSSFVHPAVALLKRQLPWLRVALLYGNEWHEADLLAPALAVGTEAIHPAVRLVTPDLIARAHASGLAVNVWTANRRGLIRRLIAWGADGIFSDYPERVVAAREAAERR